MIRHDTIAFDEVCRLLATDEIYQLLAAEEICQLLAADEICQLLFVEGFFSVIGCTSTIESSYSGFYKRILTVHICGNNVATVLR